MLATLRKRLYPYRGLIQAEAALMLIALVICVVQGRLNWPTYGSNLALVGLAVIGFGIVASFGAWTGTRNFNYQHAASTERSIHERFYDNQRDLNDALGFFGLTFIPGCVAMVLGVVMLFL